MRFLVVLLGSLRRRPRGGLEGRQISPWQVTVYGMFLEVLGGSLLGPRVSSGVLGTVWEVIGVIWGLMETLKTNVCCSVLTFGGSWGSLWGPRVSLGVLGSVWEIVMGSFGGS